MTFNDVLADIKRLIGLKLYSIRPGAEIIILSVNEQQECLILQTASGKKRSRPLRELRTIWYLMMQQPVVHVEEALHGSGTSRNQPETILANLPYVEWLKVNGKKHLAFVNRETHPFGTIKEMDVFQADKLLNVCNSNQESTPKCIIITNDAFELTSLLERRCTGTVAVVQNGVYSYMTAMDMILIGTESLNIPCGTYVVVKAKYLPKAGRVITIAEKEYELLSSGVANILLTN